ncbi:Glycine zipper 2TM domain-containing protein [Duganella sp. CF517]|uniref:glycine zipper 2TM domain-containing protein n=1 Tax=Duganella sp. CF517 TaxID=1881038 RepID=UPI0008D4C41D|nr:glycine zipper 2TM domain-containing protein [Duganella sp. CF517]SEN69275.1 Glycine zipper 2TM domain-containing protein [Duganella sp. CF517]
MEHTLPNRMHPLLAVAAFSVTLVSLVGAASILGLLPYSQAKGSVQPEISATAPMMQANQPLSAQGQAPQPQPRQVVEHRTVVHHTYAPARQASRNDDRNEVAQAPPQRAPAPAPQNSAVGIGLGAVVGGLLGNQVGGGKGRTLATIAGAMGGAYAGNEIAKRNQQQQ